MDVVNLKIKDLQPYEKNPRKNDGAVDYVANSIKEFGFKVPIVVDKDNVIGPDTHAIRRRKSWG